MIERDTKNIFDYFPSERYSDVLITNISQTREQISNMKRDMGWLSREDQLFVKSLHIIADTDLMTLLTLRRGTDLDKTLNDSDDPDETVLTDLEREIPIEIDMFNGEKINPFSSNRIFVKVPSPKFLGSTYTIFAFLYDLRGPGVTNSIQVMELLGENIRIRQSDPVEFLRKTQKELARIYEERDRVINGMSETYSVEQLDKIIADIHRQRDLAEQSQMSL